jgi:hypothetical protein
MKTLLVPMVMLSLVALAGDLWAVTPPAKIAYVEGTVLIKKKGDDKLVPAQLGESLFYGDQVKTLGGKCQVNMTASGILRLSPNTTVLFPGEENRDEKISVMRMLKGKTEQNIENLWTNEVFEVRTPSLVAGTQDQPNTDAARVGYQAGGFIDGQPIEHNIPPYRFVPPTSPTPPGKQTHANPPIDDKEAGGNRIAKSFQIALQRKMAKDSDSKEQYRLEIVTPLRYENGSIVGAYRFMQTRPGVKEWASFEWGDARNPGRVAVEDVVRIYSRDNLDLPWK